MEGVPRSPHGAQLGYSHNKSDLLGFEKRIYDTNVKHQSGMLVNVTKKKLYIRRIKPSFGIIQEREAVPHNTQVWSECTSVAIN